MNPKSLAEVAAAFMRLGMISFGGPTAHLGYFQREFVERRHWLDDAEYADTVALCQFLPGPASSQVAFALGMRRSGLAGALVASVCFMLPSAAAMILFAYGVGSLGDVGRAGWLHGLRLAAVGVVAVAVWEMGRRLCSDWPRRALGLCAAAGVLLLPGAATQIGAMAACGLVGWWAGLGRVEVAGRVGGIPAHSRGWAVASLALFALLLVLLPVLAAATREKPVAVFAGFYRAGALVFGGGHVVLPLLRSELVPPGWISDNAFLAGYGAVQAVPGPLFTFAGYLGTLIDGGRNAWVGGVFALLAIFLPAWLLVAGAYPFWHALRSKIWARSALAGANAAVVGILLAALCRPLCAESVANLSDAVAAIAAALLVGKLRTPSWLVVALAAAAGEWVLR